jgi:hypothetical protein
MARPPGLPPMPRRPVAALVLAALIAAVLWWSVPAGLRVLVASGWDPETVAAVVFSHIAFLLAFGWIAWLFWAGRRPGDGG